MCGAAWRPECRHHRQGKRNSNGAWLCSASRRRCSCLAGVASADLTVVASAADAPGPAPSPPLPPLLARPQALQLMAAGDVAQLGALMSEAQRLFTARAAPLCPSQLTSPVLHRVLAHPPIQPHIYGGKGVGSQVEMGSWPAS